MIRSMTGYGRGTASAAGCDITVEMRSVNHRYFDCNVRLPRVYVYMEDAIKSRLAQNVSRGKTDVFVTVEKQPGSAPFDGTSSSESAAVTAYTANPAGSPAVSTAAAGRSPAAATSASRAVGTVPARRTR